MKQNEKYNLCYVVQMFQIIYTLPAYNNMIKDIISLIIFQSFLYQLHTQHTEKYTHVKHENESANPFCNSGR